MAALLGAAPLAAAQDKPVGAPSQAAQVAAKMANEWSALASNLEQRVARLLPCDARVRTAIEEVSRGSEARFTALNAYWQEVGKMSGSQADVARKLLAEGDARNADWKADRADSEQEQTQLAAQTSDLRESERQLPALANAERALSGVSQSVAAAAQQASAREDAPAKLDASLHELIAASESRQAAIENELKALATENSRWSAYYAARLTRAQMECSLTGAVDPAPAPRTPARKDK
jgi:hypothetical protein